MKRFVRINGAVVIDVTRQAEPPSIGGTWLEAPDWVGSGDTFDGVVFARAVSMQVDTSAYIDIGPFFDRFESAKFAVLASANAGVGVVLKDAMARKWIDLKNPAVAQAIDIVISAGILGVDAALKSRILNTPVSKAESFALRKVYFI